MSAGGRDAFRAETHGHCETDRPAETRDPSHPRGTTQSRPYDDDAQRGRMEHSLKHGIESSENDGKSLADSPDESHLWDSCNAILTPSGVEGHKSNTGMTEAFPTRLWRSGRIWRQTGVHDGGMPMAA